MATIYCTIQGNIEDRKVKEKAGNDLSVLQNMFADEANPYMEKWNAEWDRKHPETINGMMPGTDAYIAYGEFLAKKCNEVFERINNRVPDSTVIGQIVSVNGEMATVGVLKSDPSKFVYLGK